jgi:hypothetical protein
MAGEQRPPSLPLHLPSPLLLGAGRLPWQARRRCLPCGHAGIGGRGVGVRSRLPCARAGVGVGPNAAGGALTAAGTASALAAVADAVPAGVAGLEDPPPPIPPSLVVDPHPVVD